MATPHVAGALAIIKALSIQTFERILSEPEIYAQLIRRTIPLGYSPKLEGSGMVYLTAVEYLSNILMYGEETDVLNVF
jgi:major intracellular serine protease